MDSASEHINLGQDQARAGGKRAGRPRTPALEQIDQRQVKAARAQGRITELGLCGVRRFPEAISDTL